MGKFNLSKEARLTNFLICILYHDINCNLETLIKKINVNKKHTILIILDKVNTIYNKSEILKKNKNIKFIYSTKKNNSVPFNRNLGLSYAYKNFNIILYIDSDIIPKKNLVLNHVKGHLNYKDAAIIGGHIIPDFFKSKKNIWTVLDGCLSWFTSIPEDSNRFINFPYHLPTCNMSIKMNFVKKYKLKFNTNLNTGEDVDFCNQVRYKKKKILLIKNATVMHKDRSTFYSFFTHQMKWGRHQFYTLYKNNFLSSKSDIVFNFIFNFIFIIFYLPFMPIINFLTTLLALYPWVKYNVLYSVLIVPMYIAYLFKGFFTYLESINSFCKIFSDISKIKFTK